jgi:hypothetical protein
LHGYSAARQYTLQNHRFGKEAAASVLMNYQHDVGEQYTVLSRSGSERLNEIIDKVIASELNASLPSEKRRHEIGPANYRARLLGTAVVAERNCYLIQLIPRIKAQYLIGGKAWIDSTTYAVVRVEGQFAVSLSPLVGAPRITEDFVEVGGFWLPGHVHSVTSSFLLGATELSIHFSNYRILPES